MSWARGRADIDRLLQDGHLERVTPSTAVAARLVAGAAAHMTFAEKGMEDDPAGALQLAYDAARKAAVALLAVQGLRATSLGGHVAAIKAVRAQFDVQGEAGTFARLDRLRRRRNSAEYPDLHSPTVSPDDARQALSTAEEVLLAARGLLDSNRLGPLT